MIDIDYSPATTIAIALVGALVPIIYGFFIDEGHKKD